jgi:3-hydroxybutyryl-CoA dehydratase
MITRSDIREGASLPGLKKKISQDRINRYAEVSGDFNPIHINEEFARGTPLRGTIAHGMMVLAYISHLMTEAFGRVWFTGGKLDARFKAPARPGDVITVSGTIRKVKQEADGTLVDCDVFCCNQSGEEVISGNATVRLGSDENSG